MDGKAKYIFPIYQGGMMAFLMTAIITAVNFGGIPSGFFWLWMKAWLIAWPLAAIAAFLAAPWARRFTAATVHLLDGDRR